MGANSSKTTPKFPREPKSPKCNEHFHASHPWRASKKIRACQSTLHPTHNVCEDCHQKVRIFLTPGQRHFEKVGVAATLCRDCSSKAIKTYGTEYDGCTCPHAESDKQDDWFCFECRQTRLWQVGLAALEWCEYEHGDDRACNPSKDRFRGVVAKPHLSVCPKCPNSGTPFCEREAGKEVAVVKICLICEGVLVGPLLNKKGKNKRKGRRQSDFESSTSQLFEVEHTPKFTLPDCTGQITGRRRPAIDLDEDVAQDEMPRTSNQGNMFPQADRSAIDGDVSAQFDRLALSTQESDPTTPQSQNTLANQPTPSRNPQQTLQPESHRPSNQDLPPTLQFRPLEWNFPRHPAQRPHNAYNEDDYPPLSSPPKPHSLEELREMKHETVEMRRQFRENNCC